MSELISGKEALIALANGEDVEMADSEVGMDWTVISKHGFLDEQKISTPCLPMFFEESENIQFRLKPRTITINGIEVPAPDHIEKNPNLYGGWAINIGSEYYMYKSESNYNIVVAALRSIFGKK